MQHISLFYFSFSEILIIILLLFIYFKINLENKHQKERIESLSLYNKSLQEMYDGIRCFKHDFINFIQSLEGYIKCNDMNGIKSMTEAIYNESKIICNLEAITPEKIGNNAIYNLLINKYNEAINKNIVMNFEINYNISNAIINTYKLSRIIGIFIDNAIEASQKSDEKIINVRFIKENDDIIIIIENSYLNENLDIDKIFEKSYTSKLDNKNHGLGLWKVKEIIDKTDSIDLFTEKDVLFRQQLKVAIKKEKYSLKHKKTLLEQ